MNSSNAVHQSAWENIPTTRRVTRPVAVVIPCYRSREQVGKVLDAIGPEVQMIFVIDDACPEGTGEFVKSYTTDPRVKVIFQSQNTGVGGAVLRGYAEAIANGASIIVKLDSDGQMDPRLIKLFVEPILRRKADYTKGNRFFDIESLQQMPLLRRLGNAGLSFVSKLSSGYWKVMDPTNGYTAIAAPVAALLPFNKIAQRYFFESDMLFRLNTIQAVVEDIPMDAQYGDEESNLRISKILIEFPFLHLSRFFKRLVYNYFLRDFSAASVELLLGSALLGFGLTFGALKWHSYAALNTPAPTGTIFIAALSVSTGLQLLLAWLAHDIATSPSRPLLSRRSLLESLVSRRRTRIAGNNRQGTN